MAVNHQHLRAFHAIALEGSFSRAARRLNVAQPTLSQQIKALEDRHQAVLFEGRRPPLRLTPMGRELFVLTQRMFATSDEIDVLLDDNVESGSTPLRIGADSPVYAARLVQALMQAHPDVVLEARIDNAGESLRRLQEAKVDVAILSDPAMDGQFFYEPIFADYLQVVLPAAHPLARAPVFPVAALAHERVIIRETASKTRAAMETLMASAGVVPQQVMELHGREAIREAIALGMGVSLFFSSDCPPDARLALVRPDRQGERAQLTGYLVGRVERRRTAMMRAVLSAAETLKALSPMPLYVPSPRPPAAHTLAAIPRGAALERSAQP